MKKSTFNVNWIYVLIFIIGCSLGVVSYYLTLNNKVLNNEINNRKQQERRNQEFNNSLKCQEAGEEYINSYRSEGEIYIDTKTAYSPYLNACVIKYGISERSEFNTTNYYTILNLNSREEIYSYTNTRENKKNINTLNDIPKTVDILGSKEEYDKIVNHLFGTVN